MKIRIRNKKKEARSIREGYAPTERGETHLMGLWDTEDKKGRKGYVAAPTIRPIDKKGNYVPQTLEEAYERGETFEFKNKKKAEKFSFGSWKKGEAKKEAMKNYRMYKKENK